MKKKRIYKIVISFLITGLLFAGLLLYEKSKRPEQIMRTVAVAKEDMEGGIRLTEKNLESYVMKETVEETMCHGDNVTDIGVLLGTKTKVPLKKGTVLQKEWFLDMKSISEQMEHPVKVSVKAEDLSGVLGGSLRSGDFVDLFFYNKDTAEASLIFRGVLIEDAYDNSGKLIAREDRERAASMLALLLEEEDVERLCELIAGGSFRMAKTGDWEEPYERLEEEVYVQDTKEEAAL